MKRFKQAVHVLIRASVSLALLYLLFSRLDFDLRSFAAIISRSDLGLLIFSLAILFFAYLLTFYRWHLLLKASGVRVKASQLLSPYCGGIFFNLFLPSTIGGDVVKTAHLCASTRKTGDVVASVLIDRLLGYAGMAVVAFCALIFGIRFVSDPAVIVMLLVTIAVLVLTVFVIFNSRVYSFVNRFFSSSKAGKVRSALAVVHDKMYKYGKNRTVMLVSLLISVLVQLISVYYGFLVARALGADTSAIYFFLFLPVIAAVSFIPVSIGGLGIRDAVTIMLFTRAGMNSQLAMTFSLVAFFFTVVYSLVGGVYYVFTIRR